MATLHMLSRSPFAAGDLDSCLRLLGAADGLLLAGDAVHALQPGTAFFVRLEALARQGQALYALDEDLQARALPAPAWLRCLDYPAFVELTLHYPKVNGWL